MQTPFQLARAAAAGLSFALLGALNAFAVPVSPGAGATALPGTTAAARPELAGTVLEDLSSAWQSAIDPMYGFPGAQGTIQSRVVRETGSGTLDFYWRVFVDGPSYPNYVPTALTIGNLVLANFLTGAAFDADFRLDGLGSSAPADGLAANAGSFTYEFSTSTFGPGSSSYFLLLHSNATTYDQSALAALGVSNIATFAPTAAVPEPQTYALLLAGLMMCVVVQRRQRLAQQD